VELITRIVNVRAKHNIVRELQTIQPQLVVVVHPLTQRFVDMVRRNYCLPFRLVTVVTDLVSLHYSWIYPEVDLCVLPTDEAHTLMLQRGMPSDLLMRTGFPVHPKFVTYARSQLESRRDLGLVENRFTILVTGGGVGAGRVHELVLMLEQYCPDKQILVVTGKNQALYQELRAKRRSQHTHIYGFVQNMEALMAASDIVVTKAGPGTLMEALVMRRPVIVTGAVGMQEWGNIDFVLNHGLGVFRPTITRIVEAVEELTDQQRYDATVARLVDAVPRNGSVQIAALLLEQLAQANRFDSPGKSGRKRSLSFLSRKLLSR
jgi:UDP-N-acetylglucosamine:LPS N-acetylglucosamine transferase